MTVSDSTDHDTDTEVHDFPALKVMERQTPPLRYGRPPYWRAPITPPTQDIYLPNWNWSSPLEFPEGEPVTVLDVNAAHLEALGETTIAHSQLTHTGRFPRLPSSEDIAPGYYRISVPYWAFEGTIVHPLGDAASLQSEPSLWIAAPTLTLLVELEAEGHLGWLEILDSWTAEISCDFTSWADRLCSLRGERLDALALATTEEARARENALWDAFQRGYSDALDLMATGVRSYTRRPDWTHAVRAQRAAATWRKAWRWTFTGRPLVAMTSVAEISVFSSDVPTVMKRPTPPFQLDPTGREVGAFRPTKVTFPGESVQLADTLTTLDDTEDAL